jgi:arginine repressor
VDRERCAASLAGGTLATDEVMRRAEAGSPFRIAYRVVEPAGDALLVLHTPPGEANRVGVALDRLAWPDIVGTIAGDDTIFVAVKDAMARRRVLREIRRFATG